MKDLGVHVRPQALGGIRLVSAMLFVLGLFVVSTSAFAQPPTYTHTYPVEDGQRLRIRSDVGSVKVRTWNSGKIDAEVTVSGHNADAFSVDFSVDDGGPVITGTYASRDPHGIDVRILVNVPSRFDVEVRTSGGSVDLEDLEGRAWLRTSGGGVTLGNVNGDVNVEASGGAVRMGAVDGAVRVVTSGGEIVARWIRDGLDAWTSGGSIKVNEIAGSVQAEASGGSIDIGITRQPGRDCNITTSGGALTIRLGFGIRMDLEATTRGDPINTQFPLAEEARKDGWLFGKINGGGPKLNLRNNGGGPINVYRL